MLAIETAVRRIAVACDMAVDAGCRTAFLAAVVDSIDEADALLSTSRNELAVLLGWPARGRCTATICSSRWNKETAGSEAGGKERQRSRKRTDQAGESRQTTRRRK